MLVHRGKVRLTAAITIAAAMICHSCLPVMADEPTGPVAILEDEAAELLKVLTNPTGDPGEGHVEEANVFSGARSIRIVPMQRFNNRIPGWAFRIRERPEPGEYRYLRFAWKAEGGTGIMLQMHDEKDWRIRYTAGRDMYSWGTRFVAEQPPQRWTVVTCDLFAHHGEQTITGIALTNFDARAAYFDHIYLARSVEELDRIDATGFRDKPLPKLSETDCEALWRELASDDARESYHALWRLVAAKDQSVSFLRAKLSQADSIVTLERLQSWIGDLDHDDYERREEAMHQLSMHVEEARQLLERSVKKSASEEFRWRAAGILSIKTGDESDRRLRLNTRRVLENIGSKESIALLRELLPDP